MTDEVRRAILESKKKIQAVAKKQTYPERPSQSGFRNSPGGRRLAAIRKRNEARK